MDPKEGTTHGGPVSMDDKFPELNAFLDDIRDAGMEVTNKWKDMWHTAIQYAWGEQLQGWKLKEDWEYIVLNRIYPLMFQTIAKLAGNDPKILTHAWDDEKEGATEFAEKWAGHLQYLWTSQYELCMRKKLIMGLLDCAVFGYMVGKTMWDSEPNGGWNDTDKRWVGKAAQEFIHPGFFWADPSAESIDKSENCGTKRRVKLEWAQGRWPDFKDEMEKEAYTSADKQYTAGDLISYKDQKGSTLSISRQKMFTRLVSRILNQGAVTGDLSSEMTGGTKQKYVDIEEIYWRDYEKKHVKIEDNIPVEILIQQGVIVEEETTKFILDAKTKKPFKDWPTQVTEEYDEPLYPKGRFVLRIGRTILNPQKEEDKKIHKDYASDQVYKESRWPFNIMPYHILPHMWQGGNAVEMSRNNNDFLNMTISSMVNQVRRTADPTKLVEAGSLARDREGKARSTYDDITGLGRIVAMAKGKIKAMRHLEQPPLDPAVPILAQILKQDIDDQMFMQDVARGAAQKGQQTKAEIVRLNQNSLDYVGLQGIFLDQWIDDTGTLIAELCQNNYELDRLMQMLVGDEKEAARVNQMLLDVEFDVNIEPGSTLPFDEQKKQQEYAAAYQLLENPIPNPMIGDMLRVLNISKRKEILARYEGLQLFRQFIAMGQQLQQLLMQAQTAGQEGAPEEQAAAQGEIQAVMKQLSAIPGMDQLIQLLLQAGQLAPEIKGVA